jgi:hypothetical protein
MKQVVILGISLFTSVLFVASCNTNEEECTPVGIWETDNSTNCAYRMKLELNENGSGTAHGQCFVICDSTYFGLDYASQTTLTYQVNGNNLTIQLGAQNLCNDTIVNMNTELLATLDCDNNQIILDGSGWPLIRQ